MRYTNPPAPITKDDLAMPASRRATNYGLRRTNKSGIAMVEFVIDGIVPLFNTLIFTLLETYPAEPCKRIWMELFATRTGGGIARSFGRDMAKQFTESFAGDAKKLAEATRMLKTLPSAERLAFVKTMFAEDTPEYWAEVFCAQFEEMSEDVWGDAWGVCFLNSHSRGINQRDIPRGQ